MIRPVEKDASNLILHPVRDEKLTGCRFLEMNPVLPSDTLTPSNVVLNGMLYLFANKIFT
jgi:hypothetical protein